MKENCRSGRKRLSPPLSAWCVLLFFLLPDPWLHAKGAFTWDEVFALIEAKFPDVPTIDVTAFQKWRTEDPHLLVIDVRKAKEFQISRIPGAVNETRPGKIRDLIRAPDNKAVLYCSVGYRSARLAAKLKAKGFRQVYNLKGSIFEWANQGNRLVNNSGGTVYVHPYNARWGQLLDVDRHPPDQGHRKN